MEAYAQDAVDHASSRGVSLDFSPESVRAVEGILARMYGERPRGWLKTRVLKLGPSPEQVWTFAKMYGGYVGEVLRRKGGGEWQIAAQPSPFAGSIVLCKDDVSLPPPAKVYKRLTDGPEDDVWVYFQVTLRDW